MIKLFIVSLFFSLSSTTVFSQELFSYTEPASNMATKSIGLRANNFLMKNPEKKQYEFFLYPEIMLGISKKLMVHNEYFLAGGSGLNFRGSSLYGKYRFYSEDGIHNHFRLAAFARTAINNTRLRANAIELSGMNSGYEGGVIATKLIQKIALSSSASFVHAWDNVGEDKLQRKIADRNAVNYSLSFGKLMLPKEYTNYQQTNVNLMLELLGQTNLDNKLSYLDLAPSLQFIFLSQFRLDAGYRFPLKNQLMRMNDRGFLVRLEYNIFNAYK